MNRNKIVIDDSKARYEENVLYGTKLFINDIEIHDIVGLKVIREAGLPQRVRLEILGDVEIKK